MKFDAIGFLPSFYSISSPRRTGISRENAARRQTIADPCLPRRSRRLLPLCAFAPLRETPTQIPLIPRTQSARGAPEEVDVGGGFEGCDSLWRQRVWHVLGRRRL